MVSIGLQLSDINNEDVLIMTFYSKEGVAKLRLNSTSMTYNGSSRDIRIQRGGNFDPSDKTDYHLVQIYSQYLYTDNATNDSYFQLSFYIDGVLEQSMAALSTQMLQISSIELNNINASYKLIEVDYRNTTSVVDGKTTLANCDYEAYKYFLKFKDLILGNSEAEEQADLLPLLAGFNVDTSTGRVTTSYANINNLASKQKIPVMLMTYDSKQSSSTTDIIDLLEMDYGEDGTATGSDNSWTIGLEYSQGNTSLTDIVFPAGFSTGQFTLKMQGSSTKHYRVKNFTLGLQNTDTDENAKDYIFSPNFDISDFSTFLPEQEFTLKADIVDSSHSNNTSCGKFVNTVCKKFITNTSAETEEDKKYGGFVRNCLEGFPFMLFFEVIRYVGDNVESTYYYFGVYNFNLGRSSYFNLGYKNLSLLAGITEDSKKSGGFTFYAINRGTNGIKQGVGVCEV